MICIWTHRSLINQTFCSKNNRSIVVDRVGRLETHWSDCTGDFVSMLLMLLALLVLLVLLIASLKCTVHRACRRTSRVNRQSELPIDSVAWDLMALECQKFDAISLLKVLVVMKHCSKSFGPNVMESIIRSLVMKSDRGAETANGRQTVRWTMSMFRKENAEDFNLWGSFLLDVNKVHLWHQMFWTFDKMYRRVLFINHTNRWTHRLKASYSLKS